MNYDKVFLPTLRRLSQLVSRQYGCQFEYLTDIELRKTSGQGLIIQLASGKPAITENGMFFPVMPKGILVGAAYVAGHRKLAQNEISSLNQVVRMVLESTLLNIERMDTIDVLEQQLDRMQDDSNIIHLEDRRPSKFMEVELPKTRKLETLSFPFLIEAPSEEDAFRMALEVHDHSGRKFFTPLEDLDSSLFESAANLRSLGPATIFATCFEHLPLERQKVFVDYFNGTRGRGCPQIVLGTTRTFADLKRDNQVDPEFLAKLTVGYLYMSEPFSAYKSKDIIEFFFDSMTGRSHLNDQ